MGLEYATETKPHVMAPALWEEAPDSRSRRAPFRPLEQKWTGGSSITA